MGSGNQTVTQRADPWKPAMPFLETGLEAAKNLYGQGGFANPVYGGQRVAGFGDTSQMGQNMLLDAARAPNATASAQSHLTRMMDPNYTSSQLDAVKENALGSAIPAATSMFSGSGMLNSTMAMDTVGRAAAEAVAPYEYGAYENAQGRALQAAGMAPEIDRGMYLPGTMVSGVGGAQDAMRQAEIDAQMQQFYEGANPELQNLRGFADFILPISGQGGSTSSTQPGPSTLQSLAAGGLTGVGTYGALAPVLAGGTANPYLLPLSIGAGLMGMVF